MTMNGEDAVLRALREQDALIAAQGSAIWVGAEPTFTDRFSTDPQWHGQALGRGKEVRGRALAAALAAATPGCVLLRTLGRLYPGEQDRRWSYGLLSRRDGAALWSGPPDPLLGGAGADARTLAGFAAALDEGLPARGWSGFGLAADAPWEHRLVLCGDGRAITPSLGADPRLRRPSAHARGADPGATCDGLAAEGWYLLIISLLEEAGQGYAALELPHLGNEERVLALLGLVGDAAAAAGLDGLILRGHPPVAGPGLRWTTVTPDPGVVEINQAPGGALAEHLVENRRLFAIAAGQGLSPYRLQYNGQVEDSGGGGQISIGGPVPEQSPFFTHPHLLPALVRYLNHHPSLSYWFAPHYVGAFSQAPRPDEGIADLFHELALTLDALHRLGSPTPELLWRGLNPFLRDVSGNAHRSELNVEKLWSPCPRPDGIAGVVELRAFRMAGTPEAAAAVATLVRSLIAMLRAHPFLQPLQDWGDRLHDRFALPFYLEQDLEAVLGDLANAGLGLAEPLLACLRGEYSRELVSKRLADDTLTLATALEFWPQVGDTMSQPAESRLVDASTARLEIRLVGESAERLADWRLTVAGLAVPMRAESGRDGPVRVIGLRYRRYGVEQGLHPSIRPELPIRFQLYNTRSGHLLSAAYHEWRPDGGAYPGLPRDLREAEQRRAERLVCEHAVATGPPLAREPPPEALSDFCLDLRRV